MKFIGFAFFTNANLEFPLPIAAVYNLPVSSARQWNVFRHALLSELFFSGSYGTNQFAYRRFTALVMSYMLICLGFFLWPLAKK